MKTIIEKESEIKEVRASEIPKLLTEAGFPRKPIKVNGERTIGAATRLLQYVCDLGCPFTFLAHTASGEEVTPILYEGELRFANPEALARFLTSEKRTADPSVEVLSTKTALLTAALKTAKKMPVPVH